MVLFGALSVVGGGGAAGRVIGGALLLLGAGVGGAVQGLLRLAGR